MNFHTQLKMKMATLQKSNQILREHKSDFTTNAEAKETKRKPDPNTLVESSQRTEISREREKKGNGRSKTGSIGASVRVRIERKTLVIHRDRKSNRFKVEEIPSQKSIVLHLTEDQLKWVEKVISECTESRWRGPSIRIHRTGNGGFLLAQSKENALGGFIQIHKFEKGRVAGKVIIPQGDLKLGWKRIVNQIQRLRTGRVGATGAYQAVSSRRQRLVAGQNRKEAPGLRPYLSFRDALIGGKHRNLKKTEDHMRNAIVVVRKNSREEWGKIINRVPKINAHRSRSSIWRDDRALIWCQNENEKELIWKGWKEGEWSNEISLRPWRTEEEKEPKKLKCSNDWLEIEGIPARLWHKDTFEEIGRLCGGLLAVDPQTEEGSDMRWARLQVRGDEDGFILGERDLWIEGNRLRCTFHRREINETRRVLNGTDGDRKEERLGQNRSEGGERLRTEEALTWSRTSTESISTPERWIPAKRMPSKNRGESDDIELHNRFEALSSDFEVEGQSADVLALRRVDEDGVGGRERDNGRAKSESGCPEDATVGCCESRLTAKGLNRRGDRREEERGWTPGTEARAVEEEEGPRRSNGPSEPGTRKRVGLVYGRRAKAQAEKEVKSRYGLTYSRRKKAQRTVKEAESRDWAGLKRYGLVYKRKAENGKKKTENKPLKQKIESNRKMNIISIEDDEQQTKRKEEKRLNWKKIVGYQRRNRHRCTDDTTVDGKVADTVGKMIRKLAIGNGAVGNREKGERDEIICYGRRQKQKWDKPSSFLELIEAEQKQMNQRRRLQRQRRREEEAEERRRTDRAREILGVVHEEEGLLGEEDERPEDYYPGRYENESDDEQDMVQTEATQTTEAEDNNRHKNDRSKEMERVVNYLYNYMGIRLIPKRKSQSKQHLDNNILEGGSVVK